MQDAGETIKHREKIKGYLLPCSARFCATVDKRARVGNMPFSV